MTSTACGFGDCPGSSPFGSAVFLGNPYGHGLLKCRLQGVLCGTERQIIHHQSFAGCSCCTSSTRHLCSSLALLSHIVNHDGTALDVRALSLLQHLVCLSLCFKFNVGNAGRNKQKKKISSITHISYSQKSIQNSLMLSCSYPLFEPFWPGGNLTSTALSKTSLRSSTVAENGRFFTNNVLESLSVRQEKLFNAHRTLTPQKSYYQSWKLNNQCLTFLAFLRSLFVAGPIQLQFLTHDLFAVEL